MPAHTGRPSESSDAQNSERWRVPPADSGTSALTSASNDLSSPSANLEPGGSAAALVVGDGARDDSAESVVGACCAPVS